MPKKRNSSKTWNLVKYILSSTGKGPSEGLKVFKTSEKHIPISLKENNLSNEKTRWKTKGKLNSSASFKDFEIEKEILGEYDSFKKRLHEDSKVILIFGKRGSGKSALGLRIMENVKAKTKRNCYALGIDEKFLPSWISSISDIEEADSESIIMVDEGAISFNSRESMRETNKELSKLMAIARHKGLTLLFITQNTGMIDRNIIKLADSLMIKEGSLLQSEMERPEIKKFYTKSKELLDNVKDDRIKYFYLIDSDFEGLLKHDLPSFWTNELSKNRS